MLNKFITFSLCLFLFSISLTKAANAESEMPKLPGVCVFDIDSTLTEPGSMKAVTTCVELGYGIGINTGEDKNTAQRSMNTMYNGLTERGHSLDHLHKEGEIHLYDYIHSFYANKEVEDLISVIGDGSNLAGANGKPAFPGDVHKDTLFQYSGGCKEGAPFKCTNHPYKYEGLESIAEFYYPGYVRSDTSKYPQGVSDEINECIILFDDQLSTVERYANNLQEGALGDTTKKNSKKFRAVYINEPGWTIDNEENAKETVCRVIRKMPGKCQDPQKIETICPTT